MILLPLGIHGAGIDCASRHFCGLVGGRPGLRMALRMVGVMMSPISSVLGLVFQHQVHLALGAAPWVILAHFRVHGAHIERAGILCTDRCLAHPIAHRVCNELVAAVRAAKAVVMIVMHGLMRRLGGHAHTAHRILQVVRLR